MLDKLDAGEGRNVEHVAEGNDATALLIAEKQAKRAAAKPQKRKAAGASSLQQPRRHRKRSE